MNGSVPQEIVEKVAEAIGGALIDKGVVTRSDFAIYETEVWNKQVDAVAEAALDALSLDDIQALLQAKTDMDVLYLDTWRVIAFRERPRTDG